MSDDGRLIATGSGDGRWWSARSAASGSGWWALGNSPVQPAWTPGRPHGGGRAPRRRRRHGRRRLVRRPPRARLERRGRHHRSRAARRRHDRQRRPHRRRPPLGRNQRRPHDRRSRRCRPTGWPSAPTDTAGGRGWGRHRAGHRPHRRESTRPSCAAGSAPPFSVAFGGDGETLAVGGEPGATDWDWRRGVILLTAPRTNGVGFLAATGAEPQGRQLRVRQRRAPDDLRRLRAGRRRSRARAPAHDAPSPRRRSAPASRPTADPPGDREAQEEPMPNSRNPLRSSPTSARPGCPSRRTPSSSRRYSSPPREVLEHAAVLTAFS